MAKGGDFEREIAKFLTKWASGKTKPYWYWRLLGSGSVATLSEENKELSGDLHALRPEACFLTDRFSIECKTGYPDTRFHQHFKGIKTFKIEEFWEQTVRDAERSVKFPMLIYRRKGMKPIIGIDLILYNRLGFKLQNIRYIMLGNFRDNIPPVYFYDMNKFFERITPDDIKNIYIRKEV